MIYSFGSKFKDYLRAEGLKHFGRKLNADELRVIQELKVTQTDKGFNIEAEDLNEEFSEFIYEMIDANSLALFYGGKY